MTYKSLLTGILLLPLLMPYAAATASDPPAPTPVEGADSGSDTTAPPEEEAAAEPDCE
ncbi:MAG: hypothetical protein WCZ87_00380 [Thiohalobacteraceae bacterium]